MALTELTAILGAVLGTSGLTLGILNYLRDRPRVVVHLRWGMQLIGDGHLGSAQDECGVVEVTNCGRRPVFVSHVCLRLPKHSDSALLLLRSTIRGQRLGEGDPPITVVIPYDVTSKYLKDWRLIRAQVSDSTGRVYVSRRATHGPVAAGSRTVDHEKHVP